MFNNYLGHTEAKMGIPNELNKRNNNPEISLLYNAIVMWEAPKEYLNFSAGSI